MDPRIVRTQGQLRSAVLDLAATRDLAQISVHDITRRAGVNRATFYQHYRDKDELVAVTIDGLLNEIFEGCAPVLAGIDHLRPDDVHPSVAMMFSQVEKRAELYRRLIGHGGSAYFIRRFQARNEELSIRAFRFLEDSPTSHDHIPMQVRIRFAASAMLGLINYWLEHGLEESAEMMATWYWRLVRPVWFVDGTGKDER
ncbi:MAG: TetR/AcrR family transcriptional regulator [Thermomicrobiales bacterium]